MASYATFSFLWWDVTFNGDLNMGAIGGGFEADFETGRFKIVPFGMGIIPGYSVDFDLRG